MWNWNFFYSILKLLFFNKELKKKRKKKLEKYFHSNLLSQRERVKTNSIFKKMDLNISIYFEV